MAVEDPHVMIAALAQPEALLVFGAIAAATSGARLRDELGYPPSGTSYVTPFGLEKKTSLPRDVIETGRWAAEAGGVAGGLPDEQGRYESWRINEPRWRLHRRDRPSGGSERARGAAWCANGSVS